MCCSKFVPSLQFQHTATTKISLFCVFVLLSASTLCDEGIHVAHGMEQIKIGRSEGGDERTRV